MLATVPGPVVFDGMFHVRVACAAAAPAPCRGTVDLVVKGRGDAAADYRAAPGAAVRVTVDPPFDPGRPAAVVVRLQPVGEPESRVTRSVRFSAGGGEGAGGGDVAGHAVSDRRGDPSEGLDLRRFTASAAHGRIVLTWTTWRPFTVAQVSHDTGSLNAEVYPQRPNGPTRWHVQVFYLGGRPVAHVGMSSFYVRSARITRPSRRSLRLTAPLRLLPKRRYLWFIPSASRDEADPLKVRVRR